MKIKNKGTFKESPSQSFYEGVGWERDSNERLEKALSGYCLWAREWAVEAARWASLASGKSYCAELLGGETL